MHEVPRGRPVPYVPSAVGLAGVRPGQDVETVASAPRLSGTVEAVADRSVTSRVTEPTTGIVEVGSTEWGGKGAVVVRGALYGPEGPAVRGRERNAWEAWAAKLASA